MTADEAALAASLVVVVGCLGGYALHLARLRAALRRVAAPGGRPNKP